MLIIKKSPEKVISSKGRLDGALIEPSAYVNNFLARSLNKFGILKTPNVILAKIVTGGENIILPKEGFSVLATIFARPDYNNCEGLFQKALNDLERGKNVYVTAVAAAMFFEWLIQNDIEVEVEFNIEFDMPEEDFFSSAVKSNQFIPAAYERLLKLFSIFYKKEIKKELKFISAIQLNMLDADAGNMSFFEKSNFEDIKKIIERVASTHAEEFSTNNLFNKLLEETNKAIELKEKGYDLTSQEGLLIIKETEATKNEKIKNLKNILGG